MSAAAADRDAWLVLRVTLEVDGTARISYRDGLGRRGPRRARAETSTTPADDFLHLSVPQSAPVPRMFIPPELQALLADLALSMLPRVGPYVTGVVPLPVFVSPPPSLRAAPWEWLVDAIVPTVHDNVQTGLLARGRWSRRHLFRLPFRILSVGPHRELWLEPLRSAGWLADAQPHGVQLAFASEDEVAETLGSHVHDVVVCNETTCRKVLAATTRLTLSDRPRLVVLLSAVASDAWIAGLRVAPGVSLVSASVGPTHATEFLNSLILGLIHDEPVHEALKSTKRRHPYISSTRLLSDPVAIHDLRISDALVGLKDDARRLGTSATAGDVDAFLDRIDVDVPEAVVLNLREAQQFEAPVREATRDLEMLQVDFGRESWGLVPLARARDLMERALMARREFGLRMDQLLRDADVREVLENSQERRVDIEVARSEPNLYGERILGQNVVLGSGTEYLLHVQIGLRFDGSVLVGDVPSIDPLLPETDPEQGHELDVVVYSEDFTVISPSVEPLFLPGLGGSKPVCFRIKALETEVDHDAMLRVALYHRDHLVQSFLLSARVGAEERWHSEPVLEARLEFSQTSRFANLDDLAPRALAIGVNEDKLGEHLLMLKAGRHASALRLNSQLISDTIDRFRAELERATFINGAKPRFPTEPEAGKETWDEGAEFIREIASLGRNLHQALFDRHEDLKEGLRDLKLERDETIQVVRHDPGYAFPWAALYDYDLPRRIEGGDPEPVCYGFEGGKGDGTPCSHGPTDGVYCVNGFWGIRHRIEQLLVLGSQPADPVTEVIALADKPKVGVLVAEPDESTKALLESLKAKLGPGTVDEIPSETNLVDLLWGENRPAALTVVGHLETKKIKREPTGPRLVLSPGKNWLLAGDISDRNQKRWAGNSRTHSFF